MNRIILLFIILFSAFLMSCDADKTLTGWFDGIESEAIVDVVGIDGNKIYNSSDSYIFDVRQYCISKGIENRLLEVLVVYNEKVYFITKDEKTTPTGTLNLQICSVDLEGNNFESFDIGEFGVENAKSDEKTNIYSQSWYRFKEVFPPRSAENIMSEYSDGYIYIKDVNKIKRFNLKDSNLEVCDNSFSKIFESRYLMKYIKKTDTVEVLFTDTSTGETKTITTEFVLNNMICGEKIQELSSLKDYDGHSYLDGFCYNTWRCIDDHIYFNFTVYNYYGDSIPITVKYDFENDKFYYLFVGHKGDSLELRVFVIPWR